MVIFAIIGIFVIFGISLNTVITFLGAITAVLVLVFRDTILGFVTGLHVATFPKSEGWRLDRNSKIQY